MDLTSLQTALKRFGFDDSDPLTTWLNAAMHELVRYGDWSWLFKVDAVANDPVNLESLNTPSGFLKVRSLRHTTGDNEKLAEFEVTRAEREFDSTAQRPEGYYVVGVGSGSVRLTPVPDKQYQFRLHWQASVDDMVNPTDTPGSGLIPVGLHYTIVRGAASVGLDAENEEDRATTQYVKFQADLASEFIKYNVSTVDEPRAIVDVLED